MKTKEIQGITIISLVVTIIILLILSGITITILTGENGIIKQAVRAKENTKVAENEEQKQIDEMQEFMEANGNDYIKNDELDENKYLKTFITEWTVSDGDTIVLPIYQKQDADEERGEKETYFNYDFKVDYGDGTIAEVKSFDDENRKHTYNNGGTYKIKIDGKCEAFSFNYVEDSKEKITKLIQWGAIFAKHYDFAECTNLSGEIPLPSKNSFMYVESFRLLFYKCENLTGTIPNDLFKYAPNVITMANIFNYVTGVTGKIPEKLFYGCGKITNFRYAFAGSNLEDKIPDNLFKENKNVKNFRGVFCQCHKLNGIVSQNIFSYSKEIEDFYEIFLDSENLSIDKLYINSPNIKRISYAIGKDDNKFVKSKDQIGTIYVPKNSLTAEKMKELYVNNSNIEVIEI